MKLSSVFNEDNLPMIYIAIMLAVAIPGAFFGARAIIKSDKAQLEWQIKAAHAIDQGKSLSEFYNSQLQ